MAMLLFACSHWERNEGSRVVKDIDRAPFFGEAIHNDANHSLSPATATEDHEFIVYRADCRGKWELRDILPNDTHATMVITTSWELRPVDKAALEELIFANLASEEDVPASLIKFTYGRCNRPNSTDEHVVCI
ncbi:uncharacterized protein PG986_009725 [Apiospora aurea]|uniref:Lipoprotein n=1 Tax=Apiospora aurea TaxID=335848 RepID=A0ABR1Q8V2_9PEZI